MDNPEQHKLMAILAYIGPLVIVSYLMAKGNSFVKFHIKQSLVLFVIEVAVWFLGMSMFYSFWRILQLVNLATLVLAIIGIINASKNQEKELPLVGKFAKHFPL